MPRKPVISQTDIINAAFKVTKKSGFDSVTARKLASNAGCSTQPIFRMYFSMDDLKKDVYVKTEEYFADYCKAQANDNETPFVDMGLNYITFAKKNTHLFKLLFVSEEGAKNEFYKNNSYGTGLVAEEKAKAVAKGYKDVDKLFDTVWAYVQGLGCRVAFGLNGDTTDDYAMQIAELVEKLSK
ncbi:TetR/AcrR family transcriptional regulator [Butyrivibrio sp. MC2013]|uniref:TetR/AcrR family transcriptional regulator n=1 Tax=Butyrivibrio sp. MC2013 TaxID=1280686 RepID=UPI0004227EE3|nr:TetR/AcrR family transcriptional regulator [Butyrivibrio sp. MC2013]